MEQHVIELEADNADMRAALNKAVSIAEEFNGTIQEHQPGRWKLLFPSPHDCSQWLGCASIAIASVLKQRGWINATSLKVCELLEIPEEFRPAGSAQA